MPIEELSDFGSEDWEKLVARMNKRKNYPLAKILFDYFGIGDSPEEHMLPIPASFQGRPNLTPTSTAWVEALVVRHFMGRPPLELNADELGRIELYPRKWEYLARLGRELITAHARPIPAALIHAEMSHRRLEYFSAGLKSTVEAGITLRQMIRQSGVEYFGPLDIRAQWNGDTSLIFTTTLEIYHGEL